MQWYWNPPNIETPQILNQILNPILKTNIKHSTWPNIEPISENDFANHPTPQPPPQKLNVGNTSAVTDLILMKL